MACASRLRIPSADDVHTKLQYSKQGAKIVNYDFIVQDGNVQKGVVSLEQHLGYGANDLKLLDDLELKKAVERHYANYKMINDAYKRQEIINKDYLGNYFIYNTDYDLMREGKSPFKDEKLLKNMMQAIRGSFMFKQIATQKFERRNVKSSFLISFFDNFLKILRKIYCHRLYLDQQVL